jgi:hypothetical protein
MRWEAGPETLWQKPYACEGRFLQNKQFKFRTQSNQEIRVYRMHGNFRLWYTPCDFLMESNRNYPMIKFKLMYNFRMNRDYSWMRCARYIFLQNISESTSGNLSAGRGRNYHLYTTFSKSSHQSKSRVQSPTRNNMLKIKSSNFRITTKIHAALRSWSTFKNISEVKYWSESSQHKFFMYTVTV